jgi:UDP-N-acetylglucosamine--N-acetylmuramyl-(pentapeptide) pyrophosphoryl-undecaprenol N-acetylglucosamine transferase
MTAGISSLVVSRAGSGTIFEIASWGIPSILIPIPTEISHDQTENAFSYARAGAAVVLEQRNLTPHLLIAEIGRIMSNSQLHSAMTTAAKNFARPEAARTIATIIMETALSHEPR